MENEGRTIWGWIRNAFPINRVVALLTPFAATLAGLVAAWLADHAPLIADQIGGENELTAIFVAAAATVVAMAYKWLDGWTKYEQDERILPAVQEADAAFTLSQPDAGDSSVDPSEYEDPEISPTEPTEAAVEAEDAEKPKRPS